METVEVSSTIEYKGENYPYRSVNLPKHGRGLIIASTALSDKLIVDDKPVDEEAEKIDEGIFYYVTPEELVLPRKELIATIIKNL